MNNHLVSPIVFLGAPRSGTTIIFEIFSRHPDLAWLTNYMERATWFYMADLTVRFLKTGQYDLTGKKKQYNSTSMINRIVPKPGECYKIWDKNTKHRFSRSFLLGRTATPVEVKRMRRIFSLVQSIQGKDRLSMKITGPSRMEFIESVLPDARFINVTRDGRAVVDSLMRVDFWESMSSSPWWDGGLSDRDMDIWYKNDKNPIVLTALLWRSIVRNAYCETARLKTSSCFDVSYEGFVSNPKQVISDIFEFCDLRVTTDVMDRCFRGVEIFKNFNKKYLNNIDHGMRNTIENIIGECFQSDSF